MPRRMLSDTEKSELLDAKYQAEFDEHKGWWITVNVRDETDENGKPLFVITRMKEKPNS